MDEDSCWKIFLGEPGVTKLSEYCAVGFLDGVVSVVLKADIGVADKETGGGAESIAVEKLCGELLSACLHWPDVKVLITFVVRILEREAKKAARTKLVRRF